MEEQFIFRVPPSVAARLEKLLNEDPAAAGDANLDLSFQEDGRTGVFCIGEDRFPAALLDLPTVVESWKTYDDNALVKTADLGQMILVREEGDPVPEGVEFPDGITPPMRDARRRRFRREADINPDIVQSVETDLYNVMQGGTAKDVLLEVEEEEAEEEGGEDEFGLEEMGPEVMRGTQESDTPEKGERMSKNLEGEVGNGVKDGRGVEEKASIKRKGKLKGNGAKRASKSKTSKFEGSDDDYD